MSLQGGVSNHIPNPIDDKLDTLSRQIATLSELVASLNDPAVKFTLTVEELAQRWSLGPEAIRRLVRRKELRPLRDFKPFRFTLKEIRDFEDAESPRTYGLQSRRKGGRK